MRTVVVEIVPSGVILKYEDETAAGVRNGKGSNCLIP